MTARSDGRAPHELRPVTFTLDVQQQALSSVQVSFGNTTVLTSVSLDHKTRPWREGLGWITAEYAMLPGASAERVGRDRRGVSGRSSEIERLIGRSLRAGVDVDRLPPVTLTVDCDVLNADGGTRTAAITGAWVALSRALTRLDAADIVSSPIAAVSVGIVDGVCVVDLPYHEDVQAEVDMNVVMTGDGRFVEVQGTAEGQAFTKHQMDEMLQLATDGITELVARQRAVVTA